MENDVQLKTDFKELSEALTEEFTESLITATTAIADIIDEKKKAPFMMSWTKIAKQRKRGGLSTRMLRAQMMKQRRRYRGRTGRKGFFLRMRPKLLRNLRKAMRSSARIKAVRHRKWTYRRAGSVITRMKGKMEKFTGRDRYRRKRVTTPGKASKTQQPTNTNKRGIVRSFSQKKSLAASIFYGTSPLLTEMFISDSVNGNITREDLITFLAIESAAVESPLFSVAVTIAAQLEESKVKDFFYDVDIQENIIYAYFSELVGEHIEEAIKELVKTGTCELLVKEGERIDDNFVSDFTVFMLSPSPEFVKKIVEEIVGTEEDFIKECNQDLDNDDCTMLLMIEKSLEEGDYDLEEDTANAPVTAESVGIVDYKKGIGFEEASFDESIWDKDVTDKNKWNVPASIFSKGTVDKIADLLFKVSENKEVAMKRLAFFEQEYAEDKNKIEIFKNVKEKLLLKYQ